MAVQEKQLNTTAKEIKIDLSFMRKSKIKEALVKLGNLLKLGKLKGNNEFDPSKYDVEKARQIQMSNYNNISEMAHLYSRRF